MGRAYAVLAVCFAAVLASAAVALLLLTADLRAQDPGTRPGDLQQGEAVPPGEGEDPMGGALDAPPQPDDGVTLPLTQDAGQSYVEQTLFLGDSNTARLYRLFDLCTYNNAIGSVGMAARQLASYACVGFAGSSDYVTMPQAVGRLQPTRVLITFGTNDVGPSLSAQDFVASYEKGIQAVQAACPGVDIIVNSIPPVTRRPASALLSQLQIDAYNAALVEMCRENGWRFLNSAEALKGSDGYLLPEYSEADGYHLTHAGLQAMLTYLRTHSYHADAAGAAIKTEPAHDRDRDVAEFSAALPTTSPSPSPSTSPKPSPSASPKPTPEDPEEEEPEATKEPEMTAAPTEQPTAAPTEEPTATPTPTQEPEPTQAPADPAPTPDPIQTPTQAPTQPEADPAG